MFAFTTKGRRGFTLIELLVVIAIIAILIALLVPAVQKVREAAARTHCQNNMKQVALAMHNYHGTLKHYPKGVWRSAGNPRLFEYWSWLAQLLPYIEQDNVYKMADNWQLQPGSGYQTGTAAYYWWPWGDFWTNWSTAKWNPALETYMPLFSCPSEQRYLVVADSDGLKVAFTTYLGVSSSGTGDFSQLSSNINNRNGTLIHNRKLRIADITDGTSNTLMIGERPPSQDLYYGWWFAGAGWDGSGTGDVVLGAGDTAYASAIGCSPALVGFRPGIVKNNCDQVHFWSHHSNGGNFALGDASVRWLSYSISPAVFAASCSRNLNEAVNLD